MYPTIVAQGLDGVLWLLFKQDIKHRMRCPKNRTTTRSKPYIKKLPNVSHNPKWLGDTPKGPKKPNAKKKVAMNQLPKKRRGTQLTALGALVCLGNNKRAHAPGREQSTYYLVSIKITSFLVRDSKRKLQILSKRRIAKINILMPIYKNYHSPQSM